MNNEDRELTFESGYFIHSKRSNYQNYLHKRFDVLADDLIHLLPLTERSRVLDFGCATGGLLRGLKQRGLSDVFGTDISYFAVDYGRKILGLDKELCFYNVDLLTERFDVILFLDVLEHVPTKVEIDRFLELIQTDTQVVVRVPVAEREGENYYLAVSRNDPTHIHCHAKDWWQRVFHEQKFSMKKILTGKAIYESKGVLARVYQK